MNRQHFRAMPMIVALFLSLGLLAPTLLLASEPSPNEGDPSVTTEVPSEPAAQPKPTEVPVYDPTDVPSTAVPPTEPADQGENGNTQAPQQGLAVQSETAGSITVYGNCDGGYAFTVVADEPYTGTVSATHSGQAFEVATFEGTSGTSPFIPQIGIFIFQWQRDLLTTSITYTVVANLESGGQIIGETTTPNCSISDTPTPTPEPTQEPAANIDQLIQMIIQILVQILAQMGTR